MLWSKVKAFAEALDMSPTIKYSLQALCDKKMFLTMYTDSMFLLNIMTEPHLNTANTWMINLQAVNNSYKVLQIDYIAYIKSEQNIVDAFTKVKNESILMDTLRSSKWDHPVMQGIIRRKVGKHQNLIRWDCQIPYSTDQK